MTSLTNRLIFFSIFLLVAVFFSTKTIEKIWMYYSLDQSTTTEKVNWSVLHQAADTYSPHASYQYSVKQQHFVGTTTWQEKYLNVWTAEEAIERQPEILTVWYQSSSPSISTLEKHFPYKDFFYMITLWVLGLYFWLLNQYLLKNQFSKGN